MADLNIRNVSKELLKALKMSAVDNGLTLREWCVTLLADNAEVAAYFESGDGVRDVSRVLEAEKPVEKQKRGRTRKAPKPKPEPQETPESEDFEPEDFHDTTLEPFEET